MLSTHRHGALDAVVEAHRQVNSESITCASNDDVAVREAHALQRRRVLDEPGNPRLHGNGSRPGFTTKIAGNAPLPDAQKVSPCSPKLIVCCHIDGDAVVPNARLGWLERREGHDDQNDRLYSFCRQRALLSDSSLSKRTVMSAEQHTQPHPILTALLSLKRRSSASHAPRPAPRPMTWCLLGFSSTAEPAGSDPRDSRGARGSGQHNTQHSKRQNHLPAVLLGR